MYRNTFIFLPHCIHYKIISKNKMFSGKENQAPDVQSNEAVDTNTNVEASDASISAAASEEASDIQGGARPKTKNRSKKGKNKNSTDENVHENSNQEVPNDLKDIISMISNKNNAELSFQELEV